MQSLYYIPHYISKKGGKDQELIQSSTTPDPVRHGFGTWSNCVSKFFYHEILQRNYRKMTINGHFPIIPLKNCHLQQSPLLTWYIPMDPKHSIIKGPHCIWLSKKGLISKHFPRKG